MQHHRLAVAPADSVGDLDAADSTALERRRVEVDAPDEVGEHRREPVEVGLVVGQPAVRRAPEGKGAGHDAASVATGGYRPAPTLRRLSPQEEPHPCPYA